MNRDEARAILELYRPGGRDARDPQFAEALRWAEKDAELGRWFAEQQAFDAALAASLKAIPVPALLKSSILAQQHGAQIAASTSRNNWWTAIKSVLERPVLSERKILASPLWRHWPAYAAVGASLAILAVTIGIWLPRKPEAFARYRAEVVENSWDAPRHLDLTTSDLKQVRQWLAQQHADADFILPSALTNALVQGCRVLDWRGHRVACLCLLDGPKHLHLFVADRRAFPDAPIPTSPQFEKCDPWQTASWTQGNDTYVLTGMKYTAFVKKFRKGGQWLFAGQKASVGGNHSHS